MGNSKNINIWSDLWLTGHKNLHQYQPMGALTEVPQQVSSLINWDTKWWDVDLIQCLFPPSITTGILKLFLPFKPQHDIMFWEKEQNVLYGVRSGYHLIKQRELNYETGESPTAVQERQLWQNIWQMGILNKVKIFAWRFDHDSLPTCDKLVRQQILDDDKCPFFQARTEDLYHAIFECSKISTTWE